MTNHGRDDDDTPPSPIPVKRSDSEYNLQVPIDPQWFHAWRRELRVDVRDIKADLEAAKIATTRLDQRMDGVTERIKRVEDHVKSVDSRVYELETDSKFESKALKRDRQSWYFKMKDGAAGQVGSAIVMGTAVLFVWLLMKFFQEYKP